MGADGGRDPDRRRLALTRSHHVEVLNDVGALATRVASVMRAAVDEGISGRGRCSVALSRPTPTEVFDQVDQIGIPRERVDLFQVDERIAQKERDFRNLSLLEDHLSSWIDASTFHPMPVDKAPTEKDAKGYAETLEAACGTPPKLDLVHLGLGPDGHTASLVPDDPVLDIDDRWVAITKMANGFRRMTMTYPTLNNARLIVFVVSGREKADALKAVLAGDLSKPAARIAAPNVRFYVDRDAASGL